jgi:enolase
MSDRPAAGKGHKSLPQVTAAAVSNGYRSVNTEIRDLLRGPAWASLAEADQTMIDLDGPANKSRLGANATAPVRLVARREAADRPYRGPGPG